MKKKSILALALACATAMPLLATTSYAADSIKDIEKKIADYQKKVDDNDVNKSVYQSSIKMLKEKLEILKEAEKEAKKEQDKQTVKSLKDEVEKTKTYLEAQKKAIKKYDTELANAEKTNKEINAKIKIYEMQLKMPSNKAEDKQTEIKGKIEAQKAKLVNVEVLNSAKKIAEELVTKYEAKIAKLEAKIAELEGKETPQDPQEPGNQGTKPGDNGNQQTPQDPQDPAEEGKDGNEEGKDKDGKEASTMPKTGIATASIAAVALSAAGVIVSKKRR